MRVVSFISVVSILAVACGGSTGSPASVPQFLGTWTSTLQSAEVEQCPSGSSTTPLWGSVPIVASNSNSGEIVTTPANGCDLRWAANGNVATLSGPQSCTVPGAAGGTWQATFTGGTLTLNANTLALQDQGTAILTLNGTTQSCTFTQSGSFSKN